MCVHRNKTGGETMTESFNSIKEKVLTLINTNKSNEVTRKTNNTSTGIYMLYVDDFSDDLIIPFYIGETGNGENRNFQTRYEEHLKNLLALNRLKYEHYKDYLITVFFDGNYKACKIFTYLVNHNCTFDNFHMIVLETIDDTAKRKKKELEYINDLYVPFFGFNQINCVSKSREYKGHEKDAQYQDFINSDITNLCLYYKYGYSCFNGYLAKGIFTFHPKYDDLIKINCYASLYQYKKQINCNIIEQINLRNQIRTGCTDIETTKEKFYRLEQENRKMNETILVSLIPKTPYNSHPLKDLYEEHQFPETLELNNVCYVNIEFTCFNGSVQRDCYPEICKIDYLFLKDGFKKSKTAFIDNALCEFFENEDMYYYEKSTKTLTFKNEPYNVRLYGAETEIPVSMEYRNGINEFTFKDKTIEKAVKLLKEIDNLIDDKTKVICTTSGYKTTIKERIGSPEITPNGLIKKIVRSLK